MATRSYLPYPGALATNQCKKPETPRGCCATLKSHSELVGVTTLAYTYCRTDDDVKNAENRGCGTRDGFGFSAISRIWSSSRSPSPSVSEPRCWVHCMCDYNNPYPADNARNRQSSDAS